MRAYLEQSFDSFCKTVIRNEAFKAQREASAREARTVPLSSLPANGESAAFAEDTYRPHRTVFWVRGKRAFVHDPMLAQAIAWLIPRNREIILLYYFFELTDREIGRMTGMSASTVRNRRRAALRRLRELLEVMGYERPGRL